MSTKTKVFISLILVALGVACRLLPHFWNFAPIAAIALFAGVYLGRRYAVTLPIIAMFVGDLFIGFYDWKLMLVVYGSFIFVGLLGAAIRKQKSVETVLAGSIVASILFFLATNWAVWQFSPWYAKSGAGLIQSYTFALPFFRNTLLGDLFYTSVLFGAYESVLAWSRSKKLAFKAIKNF